MKLLDSVTENDLNDLKIALLGDTVPKEDTQQLLKELADPEDEDGFFPYTPFLDRLVGKA